jgi:hypothetical protein
VAAWTGYRRRNGDSSPGPSANSRGVPGRDAWLQVLIIPLALALAATLIGATFLPVR